jgi:hypothetical protein
MTTKRRIRVAFNSLTITFLVMRRNCLCHMATSKNYDMASAITRKNEKGSRAS